MGVRQRLRVGAGSIGRVPGTHVGGPYAARAPRLRTLRTTADWTKREPVGGAAAPTLDRLSRKEVDGLRPTVRSIPCLVVGLFLPDAEPSSE